MTPEQQAAFIQAQPACAQVEALGMHAENMQREALGQSMAYDEEAFHSLITKYGIHHNAVLTTFGG